MSDLISRQAAIDALLHNQEVYSNNFGDDAIDKYTVAIIDNDAQTIAQLPSVQPESIKVGDVCKECWRDGGNVVEVVRCQDCRWWDKKDGANYGYCHAAKHGYFSKHWEISIYRTYKPDFFCADGERRSE